MGALSRPIWTDGGLATTLQRDGLPVGTPVEAWLEDHPGRIGAAHRAFAEAGARVVLAATFRSLPDVDPRWAWQIDRAVAIASDAVGPQVAVWASLGPGRAPWHEIPAGARARAANGWVSAAERAVRQGAAGLVLETFVDPDEIVAAARAIRARIPQIPLVGCLVPRPDGALLDGKDPVPAIEALLAAGVTGAGFNCGWGPVGVERALDRCGHLDAAWWAKPAAGESPPSEVVRALVRLAGRCTWVGGCCGVPPEVLARAVAARSPGPD